MIKDRPEHKELLLKDLHVTNVVRYSGIIVTAANLLIIIGAQHTAMAENFNNAFRENLVEACGSDPLGGNLSRTCGKIRPGGGPVGTVALPMSLNSAGVPSGPQERLQSPHEPKQFGEKSRTAYALNTTGWIAESDVPQLPPAGGASPDIVFGWGSGVSLFLSAGAYELNHHNNNFEDGYEAQLPNVTVGADYRINDWLLAGLAFNYTNYDGTYDDGGGFDKHIFGPLLYATFLPFEGAFANIALGYARQENRNNRLASASSCGLPGQPGRRCGPEELPVTSEGHTSANYSENQYTAGVLAGYDQPFGNVTIGPRLGLAFSHESFGSVKEDGDTGLELRYNNLDQTSVQSSLGLQASIGFETAYGIVVPQATVAWVHEYANSDRNIDARLVEAPAAQSFTFQRERPARDWASIGLGASALLPNGLQPFIQFATIQGNENFVTYGGTAGVRFGL